MTTIRLAGGQSAPAPVRPHPLLGRLPDPLLELGLHLGHDRPDVIGRVGGARHFQFFDLNAETAFVADAQAAREPDARPHPTRDHRGDCLRSCRLAEERYGDASAVVKITYET